jgi:hypothetical protein
MQPVHSQLLLLLLLLLLLPYRHLFSPNTCLLRSQVRIAA